MRSISGSAGPEECSLTDLEGGVAAGAVAAESTTGAGGSAGWLPTCALSSMAGALPTGSSGAASSRLTPLLLLRDRLASPVEAAALGALLPAAGFCWGLVLAFFSCFHMAGRTTARLAGVLRSLCQ